MTKIELLAYGQVASSLVMTIAWLIAKRIGNASHVDALWAYGVGILGSTYVYFSNGDSSRKAFLMVILGVWSLRLGTHLLMRCLRGDEDSRYGHYRQKWGDKADNFFFFFFQKQAFWVVLFASPMLIAGNNPEKFPSVMDGFGLAIWLAGMGGVCLADLQLSRFRSSPERKNGEICTSGLWRYSRHPNYFFEWVLWTGYVFWGWDSPEGPALLIVPILLLAFLLKFTGIPHIEARKMETAGEAYQAYRESTSAFIPLPPKKSSAEHK